MGLGANDGLRLGAKDGFALIDGFAIGANEGDTDGFRLGANDGF